MTGLERAYRSEVRKAVENGDNARAAELREWAFEKHDIDILDFMVDVGT